MDPPNQQYAELAELAGGFIHEIKNHLSTLGLNLQLLAEDFQEPQSHRERRAQERIHRLQSECEHLLDIANDFLRFARLKDLQLEPTDVALLIEDLVDFFGPTARQANIEVVERFLHRQELDTIDELFLVGTTCEVLPVVRVEGRPVKDGKPGALTRRLQAIYTESVQAFLR